VISVAIDKYSYVVVDQNGSKPSHFEAQSDYQLGASLTDERLQEVRSRVRQAVLEHFGLTTGLSIFISSQLPCSVGLATSTAEAMALIKAASEVSGRRLGARELAELAGRLVIDQLQLPWGPEDHYSIAFGGLNCMTYEADSVQVVPISLSDSVVTELESRLMLFFTGRPNNWWDLLNERKRLTDGNRARAVRALHASKAAALGLRGDLERGDIDGVGGWLHMVWLAKKQLIDGVSDGWIDQWYDVARKAGAQGGEIVGPGGGGFMLLYAEPDRQDAITAALVTAGLTRTRFQFEANGPAVLANQDVAPARLLRKAIGGH
jgi:D-glycero-alpha-D-manno-heptose-7-phosphate kinase